ncbi:bifunctional diguanylate cyclase/phosphodiesterase [Castellaniella caeni]|uniref:bifunctional diguanylate cyclase/phosphodiesterase n=1 Tax=Castellaniella caeni TaxID=266123 RepID=UPI000A0065DC|nr:bifunctional diguanylate cyclase/phosphodiesterase [Castellaniella caeni]
MQAPSPNAATLAVRPRFRLGALSAVFYVLMLTFVLGNAVLVYSLMARYETALDQSSLLDGMRTTSQQLAVRAMRLSDGGVFQTGQLSKEIDAMDRSLQAFDQGGVVDDRELAAITQPEVRKFLPKIHRDWVVLRGRLQAVMLDSYSRNEAPADARDLPHTVQRQWIADDAATLLGSLNAALNALMPQLRQSKDQAMAWLFGIVLADLLLLLGAFLFVHYRVLHPLQRVHRAARELLRGDMVTQVADGGGVGELNDIAQAFNARTTRMQTLLSQMRSDREGLERSEIIFQGLAANAIVGIFLLARDRFSFVSPKMAEIFGYRPDEMTGHLSLLSVIAPRERYLVDEALKVGQKRKDGTVRFERRGRRKDGSLLDIEVFITLVGEGEQMSTIGLVQDITESKQAESSAQLAAIAYENSSEAIVLTDATGVIIDVNPAYSRVTGYWPDEVVGELLPLLKPGRHNRDFYDEMWHAINTKGRWEGEYWLQRKSGEDYAQRAVLDTAWNHDGSVNCRVAMLSDITQKKQVEAAIWNQAHHDPLTDLPNRQYFNERLKNAVEEANQRQRSLALLFLDLDLFKEVNDSLGHAMGDRLLVEVAQRLQHCTDPSVHFVARLGGDEFVILIMGGATRAALDALCQRILDGITEPYQLAGNLIKVSASLGVARYPEDADSAETLMRHVDMAMYEAKAAGRDGYRYFDESIRERSDMQHDLLVSLPQALEAGQFFLLYQPIYDFSSKKIIKAEVLLRWRHPDYGVIAPMDFIPFAEERQLIRPLGDWVFHEAILQLAHWRQALAPGLRLTVNVSPGQFGLAQSGLETVLGQLEVLNLPADSLSLEFNEQLLVSLSPMVRERLQQLHELGMRFSVGAASVGMPALLATRHLLFETLKLERSITEEVLTSEQARLVCEAIVGLVHRLGMRVVAEGITSQAQYELLRAMGCDAGQGYWLGEPLDQQQFEQRLQDPAGPRL